MNTSVHENSVEAVNVSCSSDTLLVTLSDGRVVLTPLDTFPRLADATPRERSDWELIGDGIGIHWNAIDEDILVATLLGLQMWREKWVEGKCAIAKSLQSGGCGGGYGEAVLVLCAALSGLAAEVWPGDRIDRKRFVELLKDFGPKQFSSTNVSVPVLVKRLSEAAKQEATVIKSQLLNFSPSLVLTSEIDKSESDILNVCGTLDSREIRRCSYANLLYEQVRSGYTHEYKPGGSAESLPLSQSESDVSYVNYIDDHRRIHFPVDWISGVAKGAAEAVDKRSTSLPKQEPAPWWIDG